MVFYFEGFEVKRLEGFVSPDYLKEERPELPEDVRELCTSKKPVLMKLLDIAMEGGGKQ